MVVSKFEPKCTWFKETNKVDESSRHKVEVQQVKEGEFAVKLEISQVVEQDKGSYKLVAKNEKGEAISQIVELTELPVDDDKPAQKPKIVKQLKDEEYEETRTIELIVRLEHTDKKCTVKWFKNTTVINETTTIKQTFDGKTAQLRILKAKSDHTATYKCVIINAAGQDESSAKITVKKVEEKKKKEEEEEEEEKEEEKIIEEETAEEIKEKVKDKKQEKSKKDKETEKEKEVNGEDVDAEKKAQKVSIAIIRSFQSTQARTDIIIISSNQAKPEGHISRPELALYYACKSDLYR